MKKSTIEQLQRVAKEVEFGEIETLPDTGGNIIHQNSKIIECQLVEFKFMGEFAIGGKYYRCVWEPPFIMQLAGADARYEGQAFHKRMQFTHHIFEMDNEAIGALVRKAYDEFYASVENWKENGL